LHDYGTASGTCQEVVDAAKAMDELLAHPGERPTAVVADNDLVALG